MKKLMLFIILVVLLNINANASELPPAYSTQNNQTKSEIDSSALKNKQKLDTLYPWHNSLFLAGGYGTPQGLRFELGYNIFTLFSLGISFGIHDNWSNNPGEGTFGFFGMLHFPFFNTKYTPYLLFCFGSSIRIFGGEDSYALTYIGCTVPILPWLQCRPEAGAAFLSKHISGGRGIFGLTPEVRSDFTKFGANLTFEVDIRKLF
jgi:hypothetical protein